MLSDLRQTQRPRSEDRGRCFCLPDTDLYGLCPHIPVQEAPTHWVRTVRRGCAYIYFDLWILLMVFLLGQFVICTEFLRCEDWP